MSPRFVEVLLFIVTTILVGLFSWVYLRDRQHKSWLWLLGWLAIFVHFAAPVLDDWLPWLDSLSGWTNVATLILAGTFFLLSVSDVYARSRRRAAFIVLITGAGLTYLTALALHAPVRWFYVLLLAGSTSVVVVNSARHYGWKHWFVVGTSAVFIPYVGWAMLQALSGNPVHGLRVYLCAFFTTTGILYLRHFRRFTPGVILTSVSFLIWGANFTAAPWLIAHHWAPAPGSAFWEIPKFFVAFGMILTLLENQTEAARASARRYLELFEANLASVYVSTFEGKILDCNSAFLQMYGFSSKEDALATPAPLIYSDAIERDRFLSLLESRGKVVNYECPQRRRDGSEFWILERAIVVREPDGRRAIEGTAIDITERKNAELALKESEERFATIFRQSLVGCVIVSLEGLILNANERFLRLIGRRAEEVIGKTAVELELWRNQLERDEFFNRLRAEGRLQDLEVRFMDSSGKK
ncbi:MAG TPA: PAS domain-containing protein, partial [Terriglobales bacterium]|nr:PAS domain-containing protein [Terriglobales bacterium]